MSSQSVALVQQSSQRRGACILDISRGSPLFCTGMYWYSVLVPLRYVYVAVRVQVPVAGNTDDYHGEVQYVEYTIHHTRYKLYEYS